jgi:hypothetical protein
MTRKHLQLKLARDEAELISDLTGRRKLRVHVVGDCATPEAAGIVGQAMVNYEKKRGKPAWTYTHAHKSVPRSAWLGARVLASCHRVSEAAGAMTRGYAVALTIRPLARFKAYTVSQDERGRFIKPITVLPCPAQFKDKQGRRLSVCEHCQICQQPDRLLSKRQVVGFQPDYGSERKVIPLMKAK